MESRPWATFGQHLPLFRSLGLGLPAVLPDLIVSILIGDPVRLLSAPGTTVLLVGVALHRSATIATRQVPDLTLTPHVLSPLIF